MSDRTNTLETGDKTNTDAGSRTVADKLMPDLKSMQDYQRLAPSTADNGSAGTSGSDTSDTAVTKLAGRLSRDGFGIDGLHRGVVPSTADKIDPCSPEYTYRKMGSLGTLMVPTPSRMAKNAEAKDALNGPQKDVPATDEEKKAAREGLDVLSDYLKVPLESRDYFKKSQEMQKHFEGMDPKKIDGAISEMNKSLEPLGMRVARSRNGEVWLGKQDPSGDNSYEMRVRLRGTDTCLVS